MILNKKVAIILINYKDYAQKFLPDCIQSLRAQSYPRDNFKIFIVDNETSLATENFLRGTAPEAELILNKANDGFAKGNNDGFRRAINQGFDYLVALNMDTIIDRQWLAELVKVAQSDDKFGVVQSRIMLWQKNESTGQVETDKINSLGNDLHFLGFGYCRGYKKIWENQIRKVVEITYASGAAVLIKSDVLKKIGMFSEEFFMYHEDTDLSWRARLAGYKVILAPDSVVWHKYEFSRSVRQFYFMERNRLIMTAENYKLGSLLLLLPAFVLMETGLLFYSFINGLWREKLKVYFYFLQSKNLKKIIKNRQVKKKLRIIGDRQIAKYLAGRIKFQEIENPTLKYIANPALNFYWQVVKNLIFW
ncbi:MAG: glycosyltransferase family 2 protein [bacterium]